MAQPTIHKVKTEDGIRYWFRIDTGINPKTGNRQQRKVTCKTRREAEATLAEMQASIARGIVVEKRRDTVEELLRTWLDAKRPHLSPTTLASYERTINADIIPELGSVRVQALTPAMVKDFLTAKLAALRARGKDGARTVELCRMRLCEALDEAVDLAGLKPRT